MKNKFGNLFGNRKILVTELVLKVICYYFRKVSFKEVLEEFVDNPYNLL